MKLKVTQISEEQFQKSLEQTELWTLAIRYENQNKVLEKQVWMQQVCKVILGARYLQRRRQYVTRIEEMHINNM